MPWKPFWRQHLGAALLTSALPAGGSALQTQALPRATAEGAAVGWGPWSPPRARGSAAPSAGTQPGRGYRGPSRTKAQLHGIAQGRQGPPLPQGADGRTQPQRRLLLLARRAAPPPPLLLPLAARFVHMDAEGLLPAGQPPRRHRRSAMALAAAPRRLRGERPVSAPGARPGRAGQAPPLTAAARSRPPPRPRSRRPGPLTCGGTPARCWAPRSRPSATRVPAAAAGGALPPGGMFSWFSCPASMAAAAGGGAAGQRGRAGEAAGAAAGAPGAGGRPVPRRSRRSSSPRLLNRPIRAPRRVTRPTGGGRGQSGRKGREAKAAPAAGASRGRAAGSGVWRGT